MKKKVRDSASYLVLNVFVVLSAKVADKAIAILRVLDLAFLFHGFIIMLRFFVRQIALLDKVENFLALIAARKHFLLIEAKHCFKTASKRRVQNTADSTIGASYKDLWFGWSNRYMSWSVFCAKIIIKNEKLLKLNTGDKMVNALVDNVKIYWFNNTFNGAITPTEGKLYEFKELLKIDQIWILFKP